MKNLKGCACIALAIIGCMLFAFVGWIVLGVHAETVHTTVYDNNKSIAVQGDTLDDYYQFSAKKYKSVLKNMWLSGVHGEIAIAGGEYKFTKVTFYYAGESNKFLSGFSGEGDFLDFFSISFDIENTLILHATRTYGNGRGISLPYYPLYPDDAMIIDADAFFVLYAQEDIPQKSIYSFSAGNNEFTIN